jgi:FHA domain
MARLVLISEGVDFATHEFIGDIVFIGRTQSNQIVIDHSTVSAQHALLLRVGDSYWLKDLNSTNGTQINGVFVTEAQLKDGDTIQFGSATAVFEEGCRKPCSSRGAKMFGDEYFGLSHTQTLAVWLLSDPGSVLLRSVVGLLGDSLAFCCADVENACTSLRSPAHKG